MALIQQIRNWGSTCYYLSVNFYFYAVWTMGHTADTVKTLGNLCHFLSIDGLFLWGSSSYNNFGKQWWWLPSPRYMMLPFSWTVGLKWQWLMQPVQTKTGFLFAFLCRLISRKWPHFKREGNSYLPNTSLWSPQGQQLWVSLICGSGQPRHQALSMWNDSASHVLSCCKH